MDDTLTEEEQIEEMKDCYSIFDRVGDMKVDHDRIIDVLRSLGLNPLTADVNKCLGDSKLVNTRVDFETFYGIYKQLSKTPATGSYDDMVEGLGTMDRETSGVVNSAELRLILMNIGDKMTEDLIDPILAPHEDSSHHVVYRDMIRRVMAG
uniref:Myosin essential light chain n=1 Tax=Aurelia sp. 2017-HT TaxID=2136148 RepID=A0A2Z5WH81_9CNID|nr:myosin essential light chain [Aurelia sp. 2017-HT]